MPSKSMDIPSSSDRIVVVGLGEQQLNIVKGLAILDGLSDPGQVIRHAIENAGEQLEAEVIADPEGERAQRLATAHLDIEQIVNTRF